MAKEKEKKRIVVHFTSGKEITTNFDTEKEAIKAMQVFRDAYDSGIVNSFNIGNAIVNAPNVTAIMLC